MATATNLLTWDAFEQLPDDFVHREIVGGELITLPPPRSRHSLIARKAAVALRSLEDHGLGLVLLEAGSKLSENPPTWIQPDVSFLSMQRVRAIDDAGYFVKGPELAIEVVSPSEASRDVRRKIDALFAAGTVAVWAVYPDDQQVCVFRSDGTSARLGPADVLSLPEFLPGWELSVANLFEN